MRKTFEDKEKVKKLIEDCSLKVFSEKGFASANMQDIAVACGISRGPLYYHFKNKKDLYIHIANVYVKTRKKVYTKIFNNDDDIFTKIRNDLLYCITDIKFPAPQNKDIEKNKELEKSRNQISEFSSWLYNLKYNSVEKALERGELVENTNIKRFVNQIYIFYLGCSNMFSSDMLPNDMLHIEKDDIYEIIDTFINGLKDGYKK